MDGICPLRSACNSSHCAQAHRLGLWCHLSRASSGILVKYMTILTASLSFPGPRALWRTYNVNLERRPIATKSVTSLVGFAIGDAVAQWSGKPKSEDELWRFDLFRTARLATYGGLVAGPLGHYWFSFLDARVFPLAPKSAKAIASKIALDQTIMTPIGTSLFFAAAKLMDLQPQAVVPTIREKLLPTCRASLKLWPLAHLVNFAFIPSSQRLLYINVISIFWTMLLSQASTSEGVKAEAVASSLPGLVLLQIQEDDQEVLASASFLDEMEALEAEYDRGF